VSNLFNDIKFVHMSNELKDFDFEKFSREAIERLKAGDSMIGEGGIFTPLLKRLIEAAMEGELDSHLNQTRKSSKNRRNGHGAKNLKSPLGGFEISAPRDRNGSFEPQVVAKRQRSITGDIDNKILSLYSRGVSYKDIHEHLLELYGLDISESTMSAITDRIIPEIKAWQTRPLESIYPVVWLDAIHFKVREDGIVKTKAVYSLLGVTCSGTKEVLSLHMGEHESSRYWRGVLHELKERGVKDIMIACIDNLQGFGDAIEDVFPYTDVQLCLVHQMRNSMKYMSDKDLKPMVADLKKVYKADNIQDARYYLDEAEAKWGEKYKAIFRSWRNNWERLSCFYKYPPALRRLIYTTNPIESYHRMVRKTTKTKGAFVSEMAALKQIYLAILNAQTKWNGTIFGWPSIRRDLDQQYGERFYGNDTVN
jgi:putative transposase